MWCGHAPVALNNLGSIFGKENDKACMLSPEMSVTSRELWGGSAKVLLNTVWGFAGVTVFLHRLRCTSQADDKVVAAHLPLAAVGDSASKAFQAGHAR